MFARLGRLLVVLAAAVPLALPVASAPASAYNCGRTACTAFQLVHAGASYGWYPVLDRYEFKGGVPPNWHLGTSKTGKGELYTTNGMLTLIGKKGSVATTWTKQSYTKGRWEVRMRESRLQHTHTNYQVSVALVPAKSKAAHCGAQQVDLLSYAPSKPHTAEFDIHTLPDLAFTTTRKLSRTVGNDQWHEFAVEVTSTHISWFIDGKVAATEKRPKALIKGVPLRMKVTLKGVEGTRMNKTRLQLDWARYWTLHKPDRKSIKAPRTTKTTYADAC